MRLTLVRHGETEENVQGVIQGQLPGKLTESGKVQAKQAAEKLRGRHFDAIYSSDLQRCLDTSEPIRHYYPDVIFITDTLLRERRGGSLEGTVAQDEIIYTKESDWFSHRLPGGGESWEDVKARQIPFLNRLLEEYPDGDVLVISHGGPVRGIRSILEGKTLAEIYEEGTPNAGVWEEIMTERLQT
jgi:broad specificity phosphatase PhoE